MAGRAGTMKSGATIYFYENRNSSQISERSLGNTTFLGNWLLKVTLVWNIIASNYSELFLMLKNSSQRASLATLPLPIWALMRGLTRLLYGVQSTVNQHVSSRRYIMFSSVLGSEFACLWNHDDKRIMSVYVTKGTWENY